MAGRDNGRSAGRSGRSSGREERGAERSRSEERSGRGGEERGRPASRSSGRGEERGGRGNSDRGGDRGRSGGRSDDRRDSRREQPEVDPGRSEIELIGVVADDPSFSAGRKTPSLWLSVYTAVRLEGADREIKGYHPVSVWGDKAEQLKAEFQKEDVVRLTARVTYELPDDDRDPPAVRLKIDDQFGDIERLDGEAAKTDDLNRVTLEGEVVGEVRFKAGERNAATYLTFDLKTVVQGQDGRTFQAIHPVTLWDRSAEDADKLVDEGKRLVIEDARLQYRPVGRSGKSFAPVITVDDLAGRVVAV